MTACGRVKCPNAPGYEAYRGEKTHPGLWPWHAAIFRYGGTKKGQKHPVYICGGSLIRNGVVLTAAHCIADLRRNKAFPVEEFVVIIGALSGYYNENIKPACYGDDDDDEDACIVDMGYDRVQINNVSISKKN